MKKEKGKKEGRLFRAKTLSLLLALVLSCVGVLSGCRESPALEQIIYTMDASEVDWDEEQLDPEDDGEEDEQFDNEVTEDAETERSTENTTAVADADAQAASDGTATVKYSSSGNENYQAEDKPTKTNETLGGSSSGIEEYEGEEGTAPTGEEEEGADPGTEQTGENEENNGDGNGEDNPDNQDGAGNEGEDGQNPENPDITPTDDPELTKQVVDERGVSVTMPQDVETVTAVGAAAALVEMIGGAGRLLAANADFTGNAIASAIFSDISSINTWWQGSGKSSIGGDEFAALVAAAPDVCFEISGENTFSADQTAQLEAAGIAYFVLPSFTSTDGLKTAASKMAEILETNSNTNGQSSQIAESYSSWIDSVVSDVGAKNTNTVMSSVYIAEWRDDISYTLTGAEGLPAEAGVSGGTGSGIAIGWSMNKPELISTFMSVAGVTNESSASSTYAATEGTYISPMIKEFSPVFSNSDYTFYSSGIGAGYDLFLCRQISNSSYYMLGDEHFPAVIVADDTVKSHIESSWFWSYKGGASKNGINWSSGYVDANDNLLYDSICGPYSIFVNPSGIGDWAEGCVESPLEAYWVAYKFNGQYSLDEVKSQVAAFYQNYFQASLSAEQIQAILKE